MMRTNGEHNGNIARPFVKWVGGKTQLLGEIDRSLPANFRMRKDVTYVEPFVGGGAVLFWILRECPNISHAVVNDINEELICTYRVIKSQVNDLINALQVISDEYLPLDQENRKDYFKFVWFTDGKGWRDAKNNLLETFDVLDNLYNICDLENGIMTKIFK